MENEFYQKYKKYKQKYLDLMSLDNNGIYYGGGVAKKGKNGKKGKKGTKSKKASAVCPQNRGKLDECLSHPRFTQNGTAYRCSYRRPDVCFRIKAASAKKSHARVQRDRAQLEPKRVEPKQTQPKQTQRSGSIIKGLARFHDISEIVNPEYAEHRYITQAMEKGLDKRIAKCIKDDDDIRDGDILFVGSSYESRQEYGFYIVHDGGKFTADLGEHVYGYGYRGILEMAEEKNTLEHFDYEFALLEVHDFCKKRLSGCDGIDGSDRDPRGIETLGAIVAKIWNDINTLRGLYRRDVRITKKQLGETYQTFIDNARLVWSSLDSYLKIKDTKKTHEILASWKVLTSDLSDFLNVTRVKKNRTERALDEISDDALVDIPNRVEKIVDGGHIM